MQRYASAAAVVTAAEDLPLKVRAGSALLRTHSLRKVFHSGGQEIAPVDGIDFEVQEGEMTSIVGPSGAGKSTFLHLLAALDTPTSGEVYFAAIIP